MKNPRFPEPLPAFRAKNAVDIGGEAATVPPTFMKSNFVTMVLQWTLAVCLLLAAIFCLQTVFRTRELRAINRQISAINAQKATVQGMINDCVKYSEKNPAIDPILEAVGVPKAALNRPGGK